MRQEPSILSLFLPVLVLVATLAAWVYVVFVRPAPLDWSLPEPAITYNVQQRNEAMDRLQPHLDEFSIHNQEAAERLMVRLDELFETYKSGVPKFAEDLTSLGTRFGILWKMPGEWINKDNRIQEYIEEKFRKHVFSEESLIEDIEHEIVVFKEDLQANQNQILAAYKSVSSSKDLEEAKLMDDQLFLRQINKKMVENTKQMGVNSIYNGLATFTASTVAEESIRLIIVRLIQAGTTSAIATAAGGAGGATVGGATTGGTAGTFGGPAGTVIGVIVGIVAGCVIDYFMTEHFERKLIKNVTEYLDSMEYALVTGSDATSGIEYQVMSYVSDLNASFSSQVYSNLTL